MDIFFKRGNNFKSKTVVKREGNAFLVGVFALITLITFIVIFTIAMEEIQYRKNAVTDAITAAVLATVTIDKDALTLDNEIHVLVPEMNVAAFSRCFAGSIGTISEVNSSGVYTWTGNESDPIFDFSDGKKIELSQFVIYNFSENDPATPNDDEFRIARYDPGTGSFIESVVLLSSAGHVYAPNGTEVYETSVFVELNIPIHTYFNIHATVPRSQLVAIQNIA